ncbi:MAG: hypothetical protein H7240_09025 [Glaciimonas sp.]|nr:hypothetical protein [Glaciimonas sp.]
MDDHASWKRKLGRRHHHAIGVLRVAGDAVRCATGTDGHHAGRCGRVSGCSRVVVVIQRQGVGVLPVAGVSARCAPGTDGHHAGS